MGPILRPAYFVLRAKRINRVQKNGEKHNVDSNTHSSRALPRDKWRVRFRRLWFWRLQHPKCAKANG